MHGKGEIQLQMGVRLQISQPKCAGYRGSWSWALKSERGRQKNRCGRWQIKNSSDMVSSEHGGKGRQPRNRGGP